MTRQQVSTVLLAAIVLTSCGQAGAAWQYAPSLNTQREMHAVAKDGNGLIYAIGGSTQYPWDKTSTVERFDEGTGVWSPIAELKKARNQPSAATDAYGRVYAIGGVSAGGYEASVERYNDALNEWEDDVVASMNASHYAGSATTGLDGSIYVIGGGSGGSYDNKVERYDPDTDTWEYIEPLPTSRVAHASVTDSLGRIYAIGGVIGSSTTTASMLRYDPTQPSLGWETLAPMSLARQWLAAVTDSEGNIWAIGGNGSGWVTGLVEIFDPDTGAWSPGPSLQQPRNALGAVLSDLGDIYAVGGGTWTNPLDVVEFIPEPTTLLLLVVGGLAMMRRRR